MTHPRISAAGLARTLNSASQPVYVLDDELTLVFCNRACRQWLGRAAEGLLGRRCTYHSGPEALGPDAVAAGLGPPPEAMAGRRLSATVSCPGGDNGLRRRRATFIPLGTSAEDVIGLVAILDREDMLESDGDASAPPPSAEPDSIDLHERVRRFRREAAARYRADRLIGNSPAMRRVRAQLELAVLGRASVLLVGPPGSGRRHTAAAIHYGGDPQRLGSLVPLACSALESDLIRSTVAALARGSPLGENARRSTLLLNGVDRLPREVQAELAATLLRRPFPLRLVATAAQPLGELVRGGDFREDLAAGLSTITIEMPSLASRREDLPLLAQLFLEEANSRGTRQLGGFTPEALDRLDAYDWPGNLDELAAAVAEAHARAEGPRIDVADLPKRIHLAAEAAAHPPRRESTIVLDEFLEDVERELIHRAMNRAKGNKAQAARLLGMTRPRLYRRLLQLGLEKDV